MNAFIDLNSCCEYMTIVLENKEYKVKLEGTTKHPYFCGKDVCDVLEQKDHKYALKTHVPSKYKKELSYFYGNKQLIELGGVSPPNSISQIQPLGLNKKYGYHEGKNIYISEPGLYSLIMGSKTTFSMIFQELVYEQILPSIREYGSYYIESQLSQAMEQLAIKEKLEEELKSKLVKAERKAIRVNKFMKRITIKEKKMEWIYIATNNFYALERLWKIGSTTRLSNRIKNYNTGRAKGIDNYYYTWAIKCYNSKDVDNHIQKLLADFKWKDSKASQEEQNRSEMYHGIKFKDLKDIVAFIVNNYDASIDYINNFIKTRLDQSMEEEDQLPPPLDYKKLTYQIGEHIETIDLEEEESESIREAFEDILTSIKEQHDRNNSEPVVIQRKDIINQLSNVTNTTKKDLWSQIKELTGWTSSKYEINEGYFKYKITY